LVYGILRTADATSPVPSASILSTLILFVLCYGVVFSAGIYYINRLIAKGPRGGAQTTPEHAISPLAGARE
jgi:cytochrome d ubiquinol oxidase subunit I